MGEFADAAGISYVYLSSIERDIKTPSMEVLWGIAHALPADALSTAQLFDLAGYGDFWRAVAELTAIERAGVLSIDAFVDNSPELRTPESKVAARMVLKSLSETSASQEASALARAKDREPS